MEIYVKHGAGSIVKRCDIAVFFAAILLAALTCAAGFMHGSVVAVARLAWL